VSMQSKWPGFNHSLEETSAAGARAAGANAADGYQKPSKAVLELVEKDQNPLWTFDPKWQNALRIEWPSPYPPISDFKREELKLAGLRIDPAFSSCSRRAHAKSADLVAFSSRPEGAFLSDLPTLPLQNIPKGMVIRNVFFSPAGDFVSFTLNSDGKAGSPKPKPMQLFTASVTDMRATPVPGCSELNSIHWGHIWIDATTVIGNALPRYRHPRPPRPEVPSGPRISDNSQGKISQNRTYPDLLRSKHEGDLLEWLTTSEIVIADIVTGAHKVVGEPRMYTLFKQSPDGVLFLVCWIDRPFSYVLPVEHFPRVWQVWDRCVPWPLLHFRVRVSGKGQSLIREWGSNRMPLLHRFCCKNNANVKFGEQQWPVGHLMLRWACEWVRPGMDTHEGHTN
jgi:hypothetical protein